MRNVDGAMPTRPGTHSSNSTPDQSIKRGRSSGMDGGIAGNVKPGKISGLNTHYHSKSVRPSTESGGSEISPRVERGYTRNEKGRSTSSVKDAMTAPDGTRRLRELS